MRNVTGWRSLRPATSARSRSSSGLPVRATPGWAARTAPRFIETSVDDRDRKSVGLVQLGVGSTLCEHGGDIVEPAAYGVRVCGLAAGRPCVDVGAVSKENVDSRGAAAARGRVKRGLAVRLVTQVRVGTLVEHATKDIVAVGAVVEVQEFMKSHWVPLPDGRTRGCCLSNALSAALVLERRLILA